MGIFLVVVIVILLIGAMVNLFGHDTKGEVYQKALDALKANPNSPALRENVLAAGRSIISHANENDRNALNDLRLSQDIEAACAGATLSVSNKTPDGVASEIAKLAELHQQGILTGDEFDLGKAYMLGHNKTDELAKKITTLHNLQKQGDITEGEFNLKKWDLLARR